MQYLQAFAPFLVEESEVSPESAGEGRSSGVLKQGALLGSKVCVAKAKCEKEKMMGVLFFQFCKHVCNRTCSLLVSAAGLLRAEGIDEDSSWHLPPDAEAVGF